MPHWFERPAGRWAAVVVGTVGALTAGLAPPAIGKASMNHTGGAAWNSNDAASSIASTMYVSAIDCAAVPRGSYKGQQSGLELFGRYADSGVKLRVADFTGVYSYCDGGQAKYGAQFVIANAHSGRLTFEFAHMTVRPGDPLELSIKRLRGEELMRLRDVNTTRSVSVHAPLLAKSLGWSAGMMPIDADNNGTPDVTGSTRIDNQYAPHLKPAKVNGPAPSAPVVFDTTTVDGRRIAAAEAGFYRSRWIHRGQAVATASEAVRGNFEAGPLTVKRPKLARTAALTRVGGSITVELPGTHRFVHLRNVSEIPNGTVIDAEHGSVQITLALPHGGSQTGVFYSGEFKLYQHVNGATSATLAGGSYAGCPSASAIRLKHGGPRASTARARSVKAKHKKTKIRGLWANAHGSFTTKGSYGAAAVIGTRWYTEDRCDGTYFYVARDRIKVTAYYPSRHRVLVTTGHHYLARAGSPAPNGKITDARVGSIRLGEARADALAAYPFGTSRNFAHKYYFKVSNGGIRIGFGSRQLLRTLPSALRHRLRNRVIWASTWNRHYAIKGIHVHASLAKAQRRLQGGQLITVGANDWYLARFRNATAVFKVDGGHVSEVGIALARLTTSRAADRALMSSFDS
jgi:hypothetical protein